MKLLFENWRKLLKEGEVIQGPWRSAEEKQSHEEFLIKNAGIANDIENFIDKRMQEVHGPAESWTREQLEIFYKIDNMLNVLFPSGD